MMTHKFDLTKILKLSEKILAIIYKQLIKLISFYLLLKINVKMSPIFKCLLCRKDIERSTKTFWKKKGHLLCSTCLDNIEKIKPIK